MRLKTRLAMVGRRWRQWVPIVPALTDYQSDDFSQDLIAGAVVGMVTVPQAIAYAYLAGLPPQAGLYACLLPMLIYGVFGSSRHLVVGPVAVAALLVASAIAQHAPSYGDAHLMISSILCLQVGLILFALRACQLGRAYQLAQSSGNHRIRQCGSPADHHFPNSSDHRHHDRSGRQPTHSIDRPGLTS